MTSDAQATAQNILDEMTAGTLKRKANKAAQLTPVGLERPRIADAPGAFLGQEAVERIISNLRGAAVDAHAVADELERSLGIDPVEHARKVDAKLAQKEIERQADDAAKVRAMTDPERRPAFDVKFAAQQAAAQETTFGHKLIAALDAAPGTTDWLCPTHGGASITSLISRKGRTYRACAECKEFEK